MKTTTVMFLFLFFLLFGQTCLNSMVQNFPQVQYNIKQEKSTDFTLDSRRYVNNTHGLVTELWKVFGKISFDVCDIKV